MDSLYFMKYSSTLCSSNLVLGQSPCWCLPLHLWGPVPCFTTAISATAQTPAVDETFESCLATNSFKQEQKKMESVQMCSWKKEFSLARGASFLAGWHKKVIISAPYQADRHFLDIWSSERGNQHPQIPNTGRVCLRNRCFWIYPYE